MVRSLSLLCIIVACSASLLAGCSKESTQKPDSVTSEKNGVVQSGEVLFKQYCASCHPDGGNVSDPRRSLYGSTLKRNHITTADDIIRIMRNPESRMIRFDEATLSDKNARLIAEYILKTFK